MKFIEGMPEAFRKTIAALNDGDQYPHCPRCDGEKELYVYLEPGDGFRTPPGEYFSCACCSHTGEAPADQARAYIEDWCDLHAMELDEEDV